MNIASVNLVSLNPNNIPLNENNAKISSSTVLQNSSSVPLVPSVGADIVFKGKPSCELLDISGLPDPCTGKIIIPKKEAENIDWPAIKMKSTSKDFVDYFNPGLTRDEKSFFDKFIRNEKEYSKMSLDALITKVKQKYRSVQIPRRILKYSLKERRIFDQTKTEELLNIGKKYRRSMLDVEKKAFDEILVAHEKNPGLYIDELFKVIRGDHIESLRVKQLNQINRMEKAIKKYDMANKHDLMKILDRYRSKIKLDNPNDPFRKKPFSNEVRQSFVNLIALKKSSGGIYNPNLNISAKIKELETQQKIMSNLFGQFPTATTDVDAFIVKYAGKKPIKMKEIDYTSQELLERFISPSYATIEHTIPLNPLPGDPKGQNVVANYLIESAGVNNRRGSIPFWKYIETDYPNMPKNAQKNMDRIIDLINAGKLKGYDFYPKAISQVLYYASKGKVNIDISALKPEIAKAELPSDAIKFLEYLKRNFKF